MSGLFDFSEMVDMLNREHFAITKSWLGLDLEKESRYFRVSTDEVLRAMYQVASRERLRPGEKRCSSCGMPIRFRENVPFDRSRENHFIACPNRKEHRRRK